MQNDKNNHGLGITPNHTVTAYKAKIVIFHIKIKSGKGLAHMQILHNH
jgi:hypothetical protein